MHNEMQPNAGSLARWAMSSAAAERPAQSSAHAVATAVERALSEQGARAALEILNMRTRYRFTGLYRVEGMVLRNLCLFDRENPGVCSVGDVSLLEDTFCDVVARSRTPLAIANARDDGRVSDRSSRTPVVSYCGVPVQGAVPPTGTLCHYDFRPRLVWPDEVEVLVRVAPLFAATVAQVSAVGP